MASIDTFTFAEGLQLKGVTEVTDSDEVGRGAYG